MKNKKNGFTLVEILAVLTILGIIALIAIPAVLNSIKSTKDDLYKNQIKLIIAGAESYVTDIVTHPERDVKGILNLVQGSSVNISLNDLSSAGALEKYISNPLCDGDAKYFDSSNVFVVIKYDGAEYEYRVVDKEGNEENIKTSCVTEKKVNE